MPDRPRDVVVRRAGDADVAALAGLRAAWTGTPLTAAFVEELRAWSAREGDRRWSWLAEDADGVAAGMVGLQLFARMPRPDGPAGRWGYLANLYVRPAARGRGAGALLVDACLAAARQEGLVRVVLSPSPRSVPLYRRAGFVPADGLLVREPL